MLNHSVICPPYRSNFSWTSREPTFSVTHLEPLQISVDSSSRSKCRQYPSHFLLYIPDESRSGTGNIELDSLIFVACRFATCNTVCTGVCPLTWCRLFCLCLLSFLALAVTYFLYFQPVTIFVSCCDYNFDAITHLVEIIG